MARGHISQRRPELRRDLRLALNLGLQTGQTQCPCHRGRRDILTALIGKAFHQIFMDGGEAEMRGQRADQLRTLGKARRERPGLLLCV